MELSTVRQQASGISRFVTVQLIALIGWIVVQTFFTLSPLGHNVSFPVIMVIEAIWWAATLVIMFVLFRHLYNHFVQAMVDLEDANRRLKLRTNAMLTDLSRSDEQGEGA